MTKAPFTILIVDDELNIRKTLGLCLEAEGHHVVTAQDGDEAQREIARELFDICFLDLRLGTKSGLDLLPKLLEASPSLKVVIITAHAAVETAVQAMRLGAFDYLPKPFSTSEIYAQLEKVDRHRKLENHIIHLESKLDSPKIDIASSSLLMQRAIELAKAAAQTPATVLITGENGTGKTVLAKALHEWSSRAKAPFATISCPSLSAELLESELFGHVKGAFTGALKANPGRIAASEGGTLFLDEIGDMPLSLQAKLLRFLQDKEYEAVGDSTTKKANVRLIAATNVDLKEAVKNGHFREDLYYRLNVIPIEMPSLRQRLEDLPSLALAQLQSLGCKKSLSESALQKLKTYDWPGNIRELKNILERASLLSKKDVIDAPDIVLDKTEGSKKSSKLLSLEEMEEAHIRKVLSATRSMEQAAQTLGIDSVTLWRKRKKYKL